MSWYRTYRPRRIADLHLTKVRESFQRLLTQGTLSQVMLFAGPKGTGKTTTARIIAALVNDPQNYPVIEHLFFGKAAPHKLNLSEPNSENEDLSKIFEGRSFLVQELDAASNRGIDDIRSIKERVNLPPQQGLMTVYILDEVHMLTTEAFNALLKLLEEPPAHVMFILATTELHKVPDTIKSRATLIEFTKATPAEITQALEKVLALEKKLFEPAALALLAQAADGSFRDAVKMAETAAASTEKLTAEFVSQHITHNLSTYIPSLLTAVLEKKPQAVCHVFTQLRQNNVDQSFFIRQLLEFLHTHLLRHLGVVEGIAFATQPVVMFLLQELSSLPVHNSGPVPFLNVELKMLDLIFRSQEKKKKAETAVPPPTSHLQTPVGSQPAQKVTTPELKSVLATSLKDEAIPQMVTVQPIAIPTLNETVVSDNLGSVSTGDSTKLLAQWPGFVELVHQKNSSLGALLRSAKPLTAGNGSAKIAVFYKFHKEQLQQPKFMRMIAECLEPLTGGQVQLEFILQDPASIPVDQVITNSPPVNLVKLAEELLV